MADLLLLHPGTHPIGRCCPYSRQIFPLQFLPHLPITSGNALKDIPRSMLYKTPRCFQSRQVANQDEPLHSLLLTRLAFGVGWVFVTRDWPAPGRKSSILTAYPLINDSQQWLFVTAATKMPLISKHHFPVHTVAPQMGITAPITAKEDMRDQETHRQGSNMKDKRKWGKEGKQAGRTARDQLHTPS